MPAPITPNARRSDMHYVDPADVKLVEANRGRVYAPSEKDIMLRAISFAEIGQLEPCIIRKSGRDYEVVAGFHRTAAARLLREGFEFEGVTYHQPDFMLKVVTTTGSAIEARLANIAENAQRTNTSPIDDAVNQRWLREQLGEGDTDIARRYGVSRSTVQRLSRLLELDEEERKMVHDGNLSVSAALELLDMDPALRRVALEAAVELDGKVSGTRLRKAARDSLVRDTTEDDPEGGEETPRTAVKAKARSLAEIKQWLMDRDPDNPDLVKLRDTLLLWVKGEKSDESLLRIWKKFDK
jgi:ParB-like chromosome segregation protein Spo0J